MDAATIQNCWHKVGILPDALYQPAVTSTGTPSVPISSLLNPEPLEEVDHTEREISDSLNQLEKLGVLQKTNQMDLKELLNPVSEQEPAGEISDEEIFQSVVDMCKAEQMMEIIGGNDVDNEVDDKKPTCKEALIATSILRNYVADINNPFTCNLEGILASFGQQTRLEAAQALESTYITDYFTHK